MRPRTATHMPSVRTAPLALLALLLPALAAAQGNPLGPDPALVFEGRMGYAATADTLLQCGAGACGGLGGPNCTGRPESFAELQGLPDSPTLRVVHARLNWAASTGAADAPDDAVTLTPPDGDPIPVGADPALSERFIDGAPPSDCQAVQLLCGIAGACDLGFYSNHADVTEAVEAHRLAGGALNGRWRFSDVTVPGASDQDPATVIAALGSLTIGAWSLLIVYEDPETQPTRRIYYYQGFELNSGVSRQLFPRGFTAPPPDPVVDLTIMVLEGDEGVFDDQLRVNGRQVSDACNPVNNLFNSTVNTGAMCRRGVHGVDLDRFTVRGAIDAGDEEANIELVIPRGNGLFTPGEQVFTNWMVLAFDHLLPDFEGLKPEKEANPAHGSFVSPGQAISYRILLENDGDGPAAGVVVTDPLSPLVEYVEGSTVVDQIPVPDGPGGAFPLQRGYAITDLPGIGPQIEVGARHRVAFTVRVRDDAPDGAEIRNIATIAAELIDPLETEAVVHTVLVTDGGPIIPPADAAVPEPDAGRDLDRGVPEPEPEPDPEPGPDPEPDPDMRRDGGALLADADTTNPCGPGTRLDENGFCISVCGAGLRWDPTCGAAGQCVQESAEPCQDDGGSPGASGCACDATDRAPGAWIALLALIALRRRRA